MPRRSFLLLAALLALAGCSSSLPPIDDPNQLASECHSLAIHSSPAESPSGSIDPSQWPPSVKRLNPVSVKKDQGCIIITTFRETGTGVRGYIVSEQMPHIDRYQISATGFPQIYTFDFRP